MLFKLVAAFLGPAQRLTVGVKFMLVLAGIAGIGGCEKNPDTQPIGQDAKSGVSAPTGRFVSDDEMFAEEKRQAESGNAEAQFKLGLMYAKGEGVAKDDSKSVELFQKSATQGNAKAQFALAADYAEGRGVAKDLAKAIEWYQKSADQNNPDAQFWLALMYLSDEKAGKDVVKAEALLQQAADNGSDIAITFLGSGYQGFGPHFKKDLAKEVSLYRKHAERGNANAQVALGEMYIRGTGVPKDSEIGLGWFRKAADQGNSTAELIMGTFYRNGLGVPKDAAKAFGWLNKAAAQGESKAQIALGSMYFSGEGTPEDKVLAYAWSNVAAAGSPGLAEAANYRDAIESSLSKDELSEAQRISSTWKVGQLQNREERTANQVKPAITGSLAKVGTGTLFVVNKSGQAITNHHVAGGCTELRVQGREGVARPVADDKVNDLALVQVQGGITDFARIASDPGKLRQGDDIVVFGYPLNTVLSSGGNLTPGVISALTGLGNNTHQIQITAPIQPGSSGSPVLNRTGDVVGVVSMKLSDAKMVKATGQVGQNINFAVSGQTLKTFLDTHKVDYSTSSMFALDKSNADQADEARKWAMLIECWK
jgi:TPR repeat protein